MRVEWMAIGLAAVGVVMVSVGSADGDCELRLGPGGSGWDDMEHLFIGFDGMNITVSKQGNIPEPLVLMDDGQVCPPPADVLNGKAYNAQYGWLINGAWSPPSGSRVWVKLLSQTAGLETYYELTFEPIFTTGGSGDIWAWNGTMTHNWYAVSNFGVYEATYEVYIGDLSGDPLVGYGSDTVTLHWRYLQRADLDFDGDVDGQDFLTFAVCYNGSMRPPQSACENTLADIDGDGDVDGQDFLTFSTCYNGSLRPPRCP